MISKQSSVSILLLLAVASVSAPAAGAQESLERYELAMYSRPQIPRGSLDVSFRDGLKELWFRALERPDAELQRMLIDTMAMAHRRGLEGMTDAKARLVELASDPKQDLDVLRSIAQTLVVLDARDQAEMLSQLSLQHGLSIAQIVEPALARWKSPVLEKIWLDRVVHAESGQTMMELALDGLAELGSEQATKPLEKIVRNTGESSRLRMLAARALGKTHQTGYVELAESLVEAPSRLPVLESMLAITVIDQHDDHKAIALLTRLTSHENTTVQSEALERLYRIDFNLVDELAAGLITSSDANVRRWCARAMIDKQIPERIKPLSEILNDVNPGIRREVASALVELASIPALRDEVLEQTMDVLDQNEWRGCEQACWVLGKLDYKPSGKRMVELLGHERGEVKVASAWGLSQLRIEELLPDMLDHAQSVFDGWGTKGMNAGTPGVTYQLAHLFISFGDQRYRKAEPLLRRYLPKDQSLGLHSRAASAWALGMIFEEEPKDDLIAIMLERMNDTEGFEPEALAMIQMCAVSLGRMKASSALSDLRKSASAHADVFHWAIQQIAGDEPPPAKDFINEIDGWFLTPNRDQGS